MANNPEFKLLEAIERYQHETVCPIGGCPVCSRNSKLCELIGKLVAELENVAEGE